MRLTERPGFLPVAVAVAAAAAGVAVVARTAQMGLLHWRGARLTVFLIGVAILATGIHLFRLGLRRRARYEAIRALLPDTYDRQRSWTKGSRRAEGAASPFGFADSRRGDDSSERMPMARAEIREATRALLVSLEEEMRMEIGYARRSSRPACRRARLRAAGRKAPGRRRVVVRFASTPS